MRMHRASAALLALTFLWFASAAHGQLRLEHADGAVDLGGRIQTGYNHRFLHGDDDDYRKNRFRMKQVRVELEGEFYEVLSMEIGIDFRSNNGGPEAKDLWTAWSPNDWFAIKTGQFKVPVSRDRLTSGAKLLFASRPTVADEFVPGRDIGMMATLRTEDKRYKMSIGAFNNRGANSVEEDDVGAPMVAARLEIMPFDYVRNGQGDHRRTRTIAVALGINGTVARDGAPILDGVDPVALHSIDGEKYLYGGDLTLKYRGLFLSAELLLAHFSPETGPSYNAAGALFQGSYYVDSLRLEPALRFEYFNPSDITDEDRERTFTFGLNMYPYRNNDLKFLLNYVYRLPSEGGLTGDGWKEDEVMLLLQLCFG